MRTVVLCLVALLAIAGTANAGANAGGTLVFHHLDVAYTTDNSGYCAEVMPRDCESINPNSSGASYQVWAVLGVFSAENKPKLRGVEFGIQYTGVELDDWGACGIFEYPMPGWPASGTGTVVTWDAPQTKRIQPVYWFVTYLASLADLPTFELTPHPQNGGHFADAYIPAHTDLITAYGSIGFGVSGEAPCPAPRTFVVKPDGSGDAPTIQAAINLAGPGSVVELEDGIYRGPGNRDLSFHDTYMTLKSASGNPAACVIDCQGSLADEHRGILIDLHESSNPTVQGIKFLNCFTGVGAGYFAEGSAISVDIGGAVVVKNCIFENCSARDNGGAIHASGQVVLEDCLFINNEARERSGGAIWCADGELTVRRCRFEGNTSPWGGGAVAVSSKPAAFEDCAFVGNQSGQGGAVYYNHAQIEMSRCTIAGNQAQSGGAMCSDASSVQLSYCTISDNLASSGSGLYFDSSICTLRNSIISFGSGSGGIRCGSVAISAVACDIYGNAGGDWPSCLLDQAGTDDNFSVDPKYCNRAGHDYQLDASSPCSEGADPERGQVGAWSVGCGVVAVDAGDSPGSRSGASITAIVPNPSTGHSRIEYSFKDGAAAPIKLEVYDAGGRLVRHLAAGSRGGALGTCTWDGCDDRGLAVPAGVYQFRLRTPARESTGRLVIVR